MTLRYNISIRPTRQPDCPADLPILLGVAGPRPIPAPRRAQRADRALVVSVLLHAAALGVILLAMRVVVPAPPPEAPTVALVIEPAAEPAPTPQPAPPQPAPPPQPVPPPQPQPPQQPAPPPEPQLPPQPVVQPPPPAPQPPEQSPPPPEAAIEPLPLPPPPAPPPPRQRPLPARPSVAQQTKVDERPPPPQPPAASAAPQPVAPQPAAPAPAQASPPQTSASWRQALAAWLASHKVYPEEARRRGEQGSVTVRFTVDPSGEVVNVAVVRGSGSAGLDAAAEAMLRGATLPPFDPTMRQAPVTATVQIRYALED